MRFLCWATLVVAGCLNCLGESAVAEGPRNWPQFRGPTGQGHADGAELPTVWSETENVVWTSPLAGRGHSSPVIWGEQIWLTTDSGDGSRLGAVCIHRDTGELLKEVLVFEPADALDIHSDNNFASPTPAIEAGRLYVHYGRYGTACIDTTSGDVLWRNEDLVIEHQGGPGSSPVLYEDLLIVNCDGADQQYCVALETATGAIRWKRNRSAPQRENPIYKRAFSTPLLVRHDGTTVLVSVGADQAHAYAPATGEELWHVRYVGFSNVPAPVADADHVYLVSGFYSPEIMAVRLGGRGNASSTHIEWRYKGGVPETPSPLLIGDRLFLISNTGIASAVDVTSGKRVWLKRLGGDFSASPITDGRHVYFCSQNGTTHVASLDKEPRIVETNQIDGSLWASPAVSGHAIFLRSNTALYRIETK